MPVNFRNFVWGCEIFFAVENWAKTGNAVEHFAVKIIAQVYRLYKMFFAAGVIKF